MQERANILGVGVSPINIPSALATLAGWVERGERHYVCVTGVHGVMESQSDESLRSIHNEAGMVTPDGMPLVWLMRLQRFPDVDRVYGPDLMLATFEASRELGFKHFLYGATPEVLEQLQANLERRYPGAAIVGSYSPPFRALTVAEEAAVVAQIDGSGANIVWVGLSTPKQERWMAAFRPRLSAAALIGVGAAFDFHAGTKRQAPRFIQRSGLEWLFRLLQEPRRLWRRYVKMIPAFVMLCLGQATGLTRYSLDRGPSS